jgi:hypothetical protein
LKAFYFAVALVVSIGPVSAKDLALSGNGVGVAQAEPSRLYRAEWLAAPTPSKQTPFEETEVPLFAAAPADEPHSGTVDAATAQISDALKAKIRAIIAFVRDEARPSADGDLLASRVRVRCAVKQVVEKNKPSLSAMPALMLSERAAAEPTTVRSTTVEACTVKLLQVRRNTVSETGADTGKRTFSIELPPLDETAP